MQSRDENCSPLSKRELVATNCTFVATNLIVAATASDTNRLVFLVQPAGSEILTELEMKPFQF